MNVTCPSCSARSSDDGHELGGDVARKRCRACDGPPPHTEEASPQPKAGSVASRGEASVLFTLAGLTGAARREAPQRERTPVTQATTLDEDDGIIDLRALASAPPRPDVHPVMPLFGGEPPPAAFARDAGSSAEHARAAAAPSVGKRIARLAVALAAIALAGVGLAYAFRGEKPAPIATATAPAPPPPPAAIAAPAPAPARDPALAAATSPRADAKATATGKAAKGVKGKSAAKTSSVSTPAPTAAAPKAAADACGCKGDFTCLLGCTVKKGR